MTSGHMKSFLDGLNAATLGAYQQRPRLIAEHHGIEETVLAGGYGYRQILELVQNGADAILEAHEHENQSADDGRIDVVLRDSSLYVANTGAPLTQDGLDALLSSHTSPKRGNEIGRFGLGFKSLLRLGGRIDVFTKTSGAIRFDPEACRRQIRDRFHVQDAPGLRLAWPLEESEASDDPVLTSFDWAETIVRVEITAKNFEENLRKEIQQFPREFLLFLANPVSLRLDDGIEPPCSLRVELKGSERLLWNGDESTRWRVVSREIVVSDERARADATHIHARQSVPLSWALPMEGKREEAGRFWAFFPTHTPTYLPGILNAPWKLNSDRNAIVGGEWNTVLMQEAAKLVVETLPELNSADDPARALDALPRQMERTDDDAAPLINRIWSALEEAAVIPDASGCLRSALELWRHPRDNAELARMWQSQASAEELAHLVHPSCLEKMRGSRLSGFSDRLKKIESTQPRLKKRDGASWFAAVASLERSAALAALGLAEAFEKDCSASEWSMIRKELRIIPSAVQRLVKSQEVIWAPSGMTVQGRLSVCQNLLEEGEARHLLVDVMGVQSLDERVWENLLLESLQAVPPYTPESADVIWKEFWQRLRSSPEGVQQKFISSHKREIRVLRGDQKWVLADEVLKPGGLVAADDDAGNRFLLVELSQHEHDGKSLSSLGVFSHPPQEVAMELFPRLFPQSLVEWRDLCRRQYRNTHHNSASWSYLEPSRFYMPIGWKLLPLLSGAPNAMLSRALADLSLSRILTEQLEFGHASVPSYPKIKVANPLPWLLLKHGSVQIGEKVISLMAMRARSYEPALAKVPNWPEFNRIVDKWPNTDDVADSLLPNFEEMWHVVIALLARPNDLMDDTLGSLWMGAAKDGVVPNQLSTEWGDVPLSEILVTASPDLARHARRPRRIVITLDEVTLKLWLAKGAVNLSDCIQAQWSAECGPADCLTSCLPELAEVLNADARENAVCQVVADLSLKLEDHSERVACLMWKGTLLLDSDQIAHGSRADRHKHVIGEVGAAGWLNCPPEAALNQLGDAGLDERRLRVANGATLAEKLLLAVGGREEPLRQALGNVGTKDFLHLCPPLKLAELTLALLGPTSLSALKEALAGEGLKPPRAWSSSDARDFVKSIGFPQEFAVSSTSRRQPEEQISGPVHLPPLHDYQVEVFEEIHTLVASGTGRRRAVVSLPTGGGKTRVVVEAAVLVVLKPESRQRCVIWVAQTDELCEQAVQAFRQVWINLGAESTELRLVRLWGGNPNPSQQELDKPVVVVASIQTLNSRMGSEDLAWLQPGMVVVDECHYAITPSYTNLLRWLNAEAPRPGQSPKDEPVMIGLSATPFRSDDEESERLARRFDQRWYPGNQDQLHARLRSHGVLSQPSYQPMESGVGISPEEEEALSALWHQRDGIQFDQLIESINQRLAGDHQRNERLVEYLKATDAQSILFFSNSVVHAEEMSARLNLIGIPAAAVSGNTHTMARRYFLDGFKNGSVRVLCNHSLLSTGFDAPKTDMVFIARQVFSPVRYMQMVGRGLRGEKNGGTAHCQIVTVMDNLGRFRDRHPYHYCQKYFTQ